jgi:AraC family transcriptional regulator
MSYIASINRGIEFIEANLADEFRSADVSVHAGVSHWHFQRIFTALTGETLKSYIRARRLSGAMKALLRGDQRIIEIAIDAGYDSQESFTRAFRSHVGVTPGEFRKSGKPHPFMEKIRIDREYLRHVAQGVEKNPEIIVLPTRRYVGLRTRFFGVESEKNNMAEKLPALWQAFLPRMEELRDRKRAAAYGLLHQCDARSGELEYVSAVEIEKPLHRLPDDMVCVEIPEQRYAKFTHRGDVGNINHTVNYIYSTWLLNSDLEHTYGVDIEEYGERYQPTSSESEIHYLVPVR